MKAAVLSGIVLATALAASAGIADAGTPSVRPPPGLVGTWQVQVTTYNCMTGVENPAFPAYLTFGVDGTLVETTANPIFAAGQRSPGHGSWIRTGHNSWRAVSEAFVLFSSTPHGPFPGISQGVQRLEQSIEFTGRHRIASEAEVQFFDSTGTLTASGCARAVGIRFK